MLLYGAGFNPVTPFYNHRHSDATIRHTPFISAEITIAIPKIRVGSALKVRSVVAAEYHYRIIVYSEFFEQTCHIANILVHP